MEIDDKELAELAQLRFDIDTAKVAGRIHPAHSLLLERWNKRVEEIKREGEAEYALFMFRLRTAISEINDKKQAEGKENAKRRLDEELTALFEKVSELYERQHSRGFPGSYSPAMFDVTWKQHMHTALASSDEDRAAWRAHLPKVVAELTQQIKDAETAAVKTADIDYLDSEEVRAEKRFARMKTAAEESIRRVKSPMRNLSSMARDGSIDWSSDERSPLKAYIMACISEVVYFQMSKFELAGKDRYRVIPSMMLKELMQRGLELQIETIMSAAEVATTFTESAGFVFGTFRFGSFTIIGVRGTTQTLADWMLDFDAKKVSLNGKGYHHGFYRDAEGALPKLIMATPADDKPIYFTGHSLGGAVAGLLPQIWQGPGKTMTPYTFGSPRFGTKKVADAQNVYAYVRALDPVPHVPLRIMGYWSSGWPPVVVPSCDHWLTNWQMTKNWKKLLPAHSIEEYRKNVGEECNSEYFPTDVYLKALKTALMDYSEEGPKNPLTSSTAIQLSLPQHGITGPTR
ncbi:MAG: hypothetical protein QOE55_8070 [Acidobacteriaceae bacterium]|jgi:hypothetical protein|nr:hypothetical protein [Acidobacteriaceae bacterium]